jgi:hypothetical protein
MNAAWMRKDDDIRALPPLFCPRAGDWRKAASTPPPPPSNALASREPLAVPTSRQTHDQPPDHRAIRQRVADLRARVAELTDQQVAPDDI